MAPYAKARERQAREKAQYLNYMRDGMNRHEAALKLGRSIQTIQQWRRVDPEFAAGMDKWSGRRAKQSEGQRIIVPVSKDTPDPGTLEEFRWKYFGLPTAYKDQEYMIQALEDRTNKVVFIIAPPGPQPRGSLVLCEDGWRKIEDVNVGDRVVGKDGGLHVVEDTQDVGDQSVYEMGLDDGTTVRAAASHQWTVREMRHSRKWMIATTEQIASGLTDTNGRLRWALPLVSVRAPDVDVPLDPYLVGVFLGDGCLRQHSAKLTTADEELAEEVQRLLPAGTRLHRVNDIIYHVYGREAGTRKSIMRTRFEALGMWGEYAYDKRVPEVFLRGSEQQRLGVLQGLMDTDGNAQKGRASFYSTSRGLVEDVAYLVRSLGGWAGDVQMDEREGRRTGFNMSVAAPVDLFRLARKQQVADTRKRAVRRKFVSAERTGWESCVCLTVEGGHYVTNDFIVTHNSGKDTLARDYIAWTTVPDTRGIRAAWIMKSEDFSRRRLGERLSPYLTDKRVYESAPEGPGTQVPSATLVDDYGPFKWQKEFMWDDGEPVARNTWNKNQMYFLRVSAPEADPNLWATGLDGSLYGSRVDEMVMSDVFDRKNQKNPATMEEQMAFINGDAMSRLDEKGRLVFLATRIRRKDNVRRMMDQFIGDSPILFQEGSYTKYRNGVAVVMFPAIQIDENGDEFSYWEDRFPLNGQLELPDGQRVSVKELSDEEYTRISSAPGVERIRGLTEIRDRMGPQFNIVYQQEEPREDSIEFTEAVLERAEDWSRSLGEIRPREQLILGVDPARVGGAAWVLGAVNLDEETITVVDFWFGTKLGTTGIKNNLIIKPVVDYMPMWLAYEVNRESAILDDRDVQDVLRDAGTSVHRHKTGAHNRGDSDAGVPMLGTDMRTGRLRIAAGTPEDRKRVEMWKEHFRAFDEAPVEERRRNRGQSWSFDPDDLALATWIMTTKAKEILRAGRKRLTVKRLRGPVPLSIQRRRKRFEKATAELREEKDMRSVYPEDAPDPNDLVSVFYYQAAGVNDE